jgi:hypothetical protein
MDLKDLGIGQRVELIEGGASILRTAEGFHGQEDRLICDYEKGIGNNPDRITPPILVKKLFTKEIHKEIVEYLKSQAYNVQSDDTGFNRTYAHNNRFFYKIHEQIVDFASKVFKQKVRQSYNFLSMYGRNGVCPYHTDRPQCKFTIDYCIDQDETWPIYIDNKEYNLEPNDAICYSGVDSPHFRKKIPGFYCNLVFFHFVTDEFNGRLD